jgi:hypothetical protein
MPAARTAFGVTGGAEARREAGLELRKRCRIKTAGALGHALEAIEQAAVARWGDDQAALRNKAGIGLLP